MSSPSHRIKQTGQEDALLEPFPPRHQRRHSMGFQRHWERYLENDYDDHGIKNQHYHQEGCLLDQKDAHVLELSHKIEEQQKSHQAEIDLLKSELERLSELVEAQDMDKNKLCSTASKVHQEHSISGRASLWLPKKSSTMRRGLFISSRNTTVGNTDSESESDDETDKPLPPAHRRRHSTGFDFPTFQARDFMEEQAQNIAPKGSLAGLITTESEPSGELLEPFNCHHQRRHTTGAIPVDFEVKNPIQDQAQKLVQDDEAFRQFKKDVKATRLVTSVGISQVMNTYIAKDSKEARETGTVPDEDLLSTRQEGQDCNEFEHPGKLVPSATADMKRARAFFSNSPPSAA